MQITIKTIAVVAAFLYIGIVPDAWAEPVDEPVEEKLKLYAVEIKIGTNWDATKAPHEQEFFKEHSMNLKKLRESGYITMGARYSDIGLMVFSATSAEEVTAFMEQDPAMAAGTFKFAVHPMNVFYPGLVQP